MISRKQEHYINRELSWLQFNARVLQEASDPRVPLLERMRFVGIFSNNLDEFFKVRYAMVKRIEESGRDGKNALKGYTAKELLEEITQIVIEQQSTSNKITEDILSELKGYNIFLVNEKEVNSNEGAFLKEYFYKNVSPTITTYILNNLEQFPKLKDNAAYLIVRMQVDGKQRESFRSWDERITSNTVYALIEIPRSVDRFIKLPELERNTEKVIFLDDLIRYCLPDIFKLFDFKSISAHMIKITRDAQLDFDSDLGKSFLQKISSSVKSRKDGEPVRFVYDKTIHQETLTYLMEKMKIMKTDSIIPGGRYHNRKDYMKFPIQRKELEYPKEIPLPIAGLPLDGKILEKIAQRDFLQYTPYHSFSYITKFLKEAAIDPQVRSIKITIYRLAQASHIANALINAAKNGKEVIVQIELQARFDEAANVKYAKIMQDEGITLNFGIRGLKIHSKIGVIERYEDDHIKRYGFISTGNFNESTAKIYTDFTMFTSHQGILKDVSRVFNFFDESYKVPKYKHLVVSPHFTRNKIITHIDNEIHHAKQGKKARIRIKINSLSDHQMIDQLYRASQHGVEVQLIIRGICCLIPSKKGLSDHIKAISVIDKYLEHPRLMIFENDGKEIVYISSADWMTRNLDRRIEVTCPVYDKHIKQEIIDTFEICWSDNVKSRDLSGHQENYYINNQELKVRSQIATYHYYLNKLTNQN